MTTFGDQLYQYGGTPVTQGRPIGMFADKVMFVDGTNGSDSNSGKTPKRALASLDKAITLITTKGGVIYIRPKTRSDSDPGYYSEAATLTLGTHDDISIIGVNSAGLASNSAFMTQIKGSTAASPIINCLATGVTIENIDFNRGSTTTGGIKLYDDNSTGYNLGNTIVNCHFRNLRGSGAASTGGAIIVDGGIFTTIQNCFFYACRCGILLLGTVSVIQSLIIKGNTFVGEGDATPETAIDADIYGSGLTGPYQMVIDGNLFAHDIPSYATSPDATAYIYITGSARGLISNNMFQTDDIVISATPASTDEVYVPDAVLLAHNYDASNALIVPA